MYFHFSKNLLPFWVSLAIFLLLSLEVLLLSFRRSHPLELPELLEALELRELFLPFSALIGCLNIEYE